MAGGKRVTRLSAAAAIVFSVAAPAGTAAPGDLDTSFSDDGWTRTMEVEGEILGGGADVALQGDRIVVATTVEEQLGDSRLAAVRYLPGGELDTSFGEQGLASVDAGTFSLTHAMAIQPNGGILLAGEGACQLRKCMVVARLHPDGAPDTDFGEGGVAGALLGLGSAAYDVAIARNGSIVLAGYRRRGGDALDDLMFGSARFTADGDLDRRFGKRGKVWIDLGYGDDVAHAATIHPNGAVTLVGAGTRNLYRTGSDFAAARFRPNGKLDRGFGRGGTVTLPFGSKRDDYADAATIDPAGGVVLAGSSGGGGRHALAIARLGRGGAVDRGFGRGGRVTIRPEGRSAAAFATAIDSRGRILVGGSSVESSRQSTSDWLLARFKARGRRDDSFSGNGTVISDLTTGEDFITGLDLQPDGRIVAAGTISYRVGVARYLG